MEKTFPRLSSSTRLVLLMLTLVMSFATLYALVAGSEFFGDIFTGFLTTIGTVVGFFFGQRETEHKTFASQSNTLPTE